MNTLDSWIDPDEISDLVSDLVSVKSNPGNSKQAEQAEAGAALLDAEPEVPARVNDHEEDTDDEAGAPVVDTPSAAEMAEQASPAPFSAAPRSTPALWQDPARAPQTDPAGGGIQLSRGPVIIRAKAGAASGMPVYGQEKPPHKLEKEETRQTAGVGEPPKAQVEEVPPPASTGPGIAMGQERAAQISRPASAPIQANGPRSMPTAPPLSPSPFSASIRKGPEIIFDKTTRENTGHLDTPEISPQEPASPDGLDDFEALDAIDESEDLDFDTPQAYEISAFPADDKSRGTADPSGDQAAFQASEALESAKHRADQSGLLKQQTPKPPVTPFTKPATFAVPKPAEDKPEKNVAPMVFEAPFEKPGFGEASPFSPVADPETELPSDESFPTPFRSPEPAAEITHSAPPEPRNLRERLAAFAKSAEELANGTDLIVADFHSYPLIASDDAPEKQAARMETVTRVSSLIALIAERIETESEGAIQIFLKSGDWLCSLAAQSPAGGVSVTMRVPNPLSAAIITRLRSDLEQALKGS